MKITHKISIAAATVSLLSLVAPLTAFAVPAVAPDLGTAASFSVFAGSAMTADGAGATVSADLGVNPGLSASGPWTVGGTSYFGTGGLSGTAKTDATAAWTTMGSTGGTTWNPATVGATLTAGLYTVDGDATVASGNTLTLNGSATDVWIFQVNSSLTFHGNIALTGGASACNVFWRVASDATINPLVASTKFQGTLIANGNVTLTAGPDPTVVIGRMMALTGTLSTAGITNISGCATGTTRPGRTNAPTITVVKTVINDNGGKKIVGDFSLFVADRQVGSGMSNTFPFPASYVVSETPDSGYTGTFSGDCDSTGHISLAANEHKVCIITNNDIGAPVVPPVPPLIDVVKVASPLSLPTGPGPVTYTYTLRNIGTVPMSNVTAVDDSCSPVTFVSGDTNNDSKLDVNETWTYRCATTLFETHTNIVTATGWANGISAIHVASATVVVGSPIFPPFIHVVKVPSVFTLPAGGGAVTYTYTVTNPGTAPLSNVTITDDKCTGLPGRVFGHPGDLNKNNLLESNEVWKFTCKSNLTQTTTNTATASGEANGLTARDYAVATVVVASPALPNTGLPPRSPWEIILAVSILMLVITAAVVSKKHTV